MIRHEIKNNKYIIYVDDKIALTIDLDKELDQVIIKTSNEVYEGPIELISYGDIHDSK